VRALHGVGTATVAPLAWQEAWPTGLPPLAPAPPPDLVLGTDIVYFAELVEPLVQTLSALAGPDTTILLANERRIPLCVPHGRVCRSHRLTCKRGRGSRSRVGGGATLGYMRSFASGLASISGSGPCVWPRTATLTLRCSRRTSSAAIPN
jgi:hypothetical protein